MARIRTIKPDFWSSPGVGRCSLRARLLYIAMWNWADDYGIGTANPRELLSFAFPNDDEVTAKDFPTLRKEVASNFDVVFYTVRERPYYCIPSWDEHQRTERKAKRYNPGPDEADSASDKGEQDNVGTSDDSRGTSDEAQGSSALGNRKLELGNPSSSPIADAMTDVRGDVRRICEHLADRIEENGSKRPKITKSWLTDARLLIDKDGKTEQQIHTCIDWCQADSFWKANILSMPKLREKYDQLRLKAAEKSGPAATERRDALGFRIAS